MLYVAGDGCFLMYPQELATAAEHGASFIVLVVNNGIYGTIRMHQESTTLALSCGAAHAERVARTEDFPAAFSRARAAKGYALIELITDPDQITPSARLN